MMPPRKALHLKAIIFSHFTAQVSLAVLFFSSRKLCSSFQSHIFGHGRGIASPAPFVLIPMREAPVPLAYLGCLATKRTFG
jgi:hypothetical protein